MHSRVIRDKIRNAIVANPNNEERAIKICIMNIIKDDKSSIDRIKKVINRLYPQYNIDIEKFLVLI
jgi:hypothetical protein